MAAVLVLDNEQLKQLSKKPELVAEFPFLNGLSKRPCVPCRLRQGQAAKDAMKAFEDAKATIGRLDASKKERLKQLTGAKQIRVTFLNARGQQVRQTF